MTILDDIEKTTINLGRLPDLRLVAEYVSGDEFIEIQKKRLYQTWFSFTQGNINEENCKELLDVLVNVRHITRISPVYVLRQINSRKSIYDAYSVFIGVNCDVETIKDALKFLWNVCCVIWKTFRNFRMTVDIGWNLREFLSGNDYFWIDVRSDTFLRSYRRFNADINHNSLPDKNVDEYSVLYHLIGRPISYEESRRMVKWCRTHNHRIAMDVHLNDLKI